MQQEKKTILVLAAIVFLAATGCTRLQARDNLNKGVRAFRDARYEAAVDFFKEAIRLDPSLTNAELYLATAYSQQFIPGALSEENQQYADLAIETFESVLQKEPSNVSAIAGLASVYQNTEQFDRAREFYRRNAELDPQSATPHYAIGSVNWIVVFDKDNPRPEEEQHRLIDEGQASLDRALELNPNFEDAMTYKNLLYREKARLTEDEAEKERLIAQADEWFDKALETRRQNQEASAGPGGIILEQ